MSLEFSERMSSVNKNLLEMPATDLLIVPFHVLAWQASENCTQLLCVPLPVVAAELRRDCHIVLPVIRLCVPLCLSHQREMCAADLCVAPFHLLAYARQRFLHANTLRAAASLSCCAES